MSSPTCASTLHALLKTPLPLDPEAAQKEHAALATAYNQFAASVDKNCPLLGFVDIYSLRLNKLEAELSEQPANMRKMERYRTHVGRLLRILDDGSGGEI